MAVPVSRERVLEFFKKQSGPQKAKDVGRWLGMDADDRSVVRDALRELADEGVLVQLEGKRFVLAGKSNAHKGSVQRKASGSGWFIPEDKNIGDAFLPPHELLGVVDGDRVLVTIERAQKGPVAKLVRVLERRRKTLTGTFKDSGKAQWVEADDNVLSGPIIIPAGPDGNGAVAKDGDVVEVLLVEAPTAVTTAVGRIVRALGKRGRLDVEIERIIAEKNIVRTFPPEVDDLAKTFPPNPTEDDWRGREDVRDIALVTIDGETAKDFDDAVYAEVRGKDVRVVVAIADVAHYVTAGSALDVEAARRGTSIYYPGKVIPMLPEALSNGLCSLKPHVDRLCMVVEFVVKPDGSASKHAFYNAVMKSHARLTYTLAQKFYDGDKDAIAELTPIVRESLDALDLASQRLRDARRRRGALDFDLPETVIALDDKGEPVKIHALERLNAHKLIEDLMVAANEAVAERFEEKKQPCVYRIHEPPDPEKLQRFTKLATLMAGRRLKELDGARGDDDDDNRSGPGPKALMAVMAALKDIPGKRALDSLLLRSMMQAKYSAENLGHYGLGSDAYLHFTSPIRRYPDLVVHRLLKDRIDKKSSSSKPSSKRSAGRPDEDTLMGVLDDIATTSSNCERVATEIERNVDALYAAWFMKDRVGETFEGLVQGVAEFGLFVLLQDAHVEGMVRVADLGADFFNYDEVRLRLVGERSGKTYGVGDIITVRIAAVDVAKRQIALVPDGDSKPAQQRPARGQKTGTQPRRRGPDRPDNDRPDNDRPGDARTSAAAPAAAKPRPRGPEELRRMFDERQGQTQQRRGPAQQKKRVGDGRGRADKRPHDATEVPGERRGKGGRDGEGRAKKRRR